MKMEIKFLLPSPADLSIKNSMRFILDRDGFDLKKYYLLQ